jgi:hypothetical protein
LLDTLLFSISAGFGFGGVNALLIGESVHHMLLYGSIVSLFYGVAFGFGGGTDLLRDIGTTIIPSETIAWSWHQVGRHLADNINKGLIVGVSVTLWVGVIIAWASGLFEGAEYGLHYGLVYGPIIGLTGGVAGILTGILNSGWSSNLLDEHQLFRPNEGMRRSLKNAAIAASLFGPIGGIASGLVCGFAFGLIGGLPG